MQQKAFYSLLFLCCVSCTVFQPGLSKLDHITWIHGAANCKENTDVPLQLVQLNRNTWVMRQNKCIHYEAPFIYLFLGRKKALLMDTGATEDEEQFPLYATVRRIIDQWEKTNAGTVDLIVAHTHSHKDHTAADSQFKNKPGTTVVGLSPEKVLSFFGFRNWPSENATLDLGGRVVEAIPIPGHQASSIAVYDKETGILLSGDSFYPGRLYISDWAAFVQSTGRLAAFVRTHRVHAILGNHIEMTNTSGVDYPTGTTFQPNEHPLPLKAKDLYLLDKTLNDLALHPKRVVLPHFIIVPK